MKGNVEWSELVVSTSILLMVLCLGLGFNGFWTVSILKEMSNEEWRRIIWNSIGLIIAGLTSFLVSMYVISKRESSGLVS